MESISLFAVFCGCVLLLVLIIAWIVLPFTIDRKLSALIRETQRTNDLIAALIKTSSKTEY